MLSHYLEQASSYAGDIDTVILLIAGIVMFWFFVAQAVFFGLIIKFSAKDGVKAKYIAGESKQEKRWITWPHNLVLLCDVVIIVFAVRVWIDVKQNMPPADATVRIIGQQWAWTFVHPGPDGKLDTADDIRTVDELHLEVNKTYHFELQSRDVLHSLSIPVFRLKQDAVPGRTIRGWFKPTRVGGFDLQCAEICGIGHALMPARLLIHGAPEFQAWERKHSPVAAAAPAPAPAPAPAAPAPAQPEGAAPAQPAAPAPAPAPTGGTP